METGGVIEWMVLERHWMREEARVGVVVEGDGDGDDKTPFSRYGRVLENGALPIINTRGGRSEEDVD